MKQIEYLPRPTFTIGKVWFDFVKRLPRSQPRYKRDLSQAKLAYQQLLQQAPPLTAQQLASLAAQQQQAMHSPFYPFPPYPYYNGNIFGGLK